MVIGFSSDWFKEWCEFLEQSQNKIKQKQSNPRFFDTQLKTSAIMLSEIFQSYSEFRPEKFLFIFAISKCLGRPEKQLIGIVVHQVELVSQITHQNIINAIADLLKKGNK